jgi:hypothetical protein
VGGWVGELVIGWSGFGPCKVTTHTHAHTHIHTRTHAHTHRGGHARVVGGYDEALLQRHVGPAHLEGRKLAHHLGGWVVGRGCGVVKVCTHALGGSWWVGGWLAGWVGVVVCVALTLLPISLAVLFLDSMLIICWWALGCAHTHTHTQARSTLSPPSATPPHPAGPSCPLPQHTEPRSHTATPTATHPHQPHSHTHSHTPTTHTHSHTPTTHTHSHIPTTQPHPQLHTHRRGLTSCVTKMAVKWRESGKLPLAWRARGEGATSAWKSLTSGMVS